MILFSDGTQCVPNLHTLKQSTEIKKAIILSITSIEIVFKLEKKVFEDSFVDRLKNKRTVSHNVFFVYVCMCTKT